MANSMITGGFGFVGRHLVRMLLDKGDNVTVFDIVPSSPFLEDIKGEFAVKVGSLGNWAHVAEAITANKVDTIYHVGAAIPPLTERDPATAFDANITGTYNILEAARLFNLKSVIFASTQSSYSDGDAFIPMDFPQRPGTFYGMTKVCGERMGESYWRHFGVNFRGVRYCIVNGPGRGGVNPGQFVVWTLQMAALKRPFKVFVEPDVEVASIYVKDAAKALIDLNEADDAKLRYRVYPIMGYSVTAKQLADVAKKYVPEADISFRVNADMMAKVKSLNLARQMDISLAREDWGFKPEFDLDKSMQDYVKQCTENRELLNYEIPEF
ncbi:MAG: NAD-dependent epimerase/dehydratase family protein [Dehalococcoidia bacterium]|nr:NAD-dependent epimerase/dehydratase family protein [Dehalococcoidia bacterium]